MLQSNCIKRIVYLGLFVKIRYSDMNIIHYVYNNFIIEIKIVKNLVVFLWITSHTS